MTKTDFNFSFDFQVSGYQTALIVRFLVAIRASDSVGYIRVEIFLSTVNKSKIRGLKRTCPS